MITASATIAAPAGSVYDYLADLSNHWRLTGPRIEVSRLGVDGGAVRLRGPLGLRRTAAIRVLERDGTNRIEGRASLGARTCARVLWTVAPVDGGCRVDVRIAVERASTVDRLLPACGARAWFRRLLRSTLQTLARDAAEFESLRDGRARRPAPSSALPQSAS